MQIISREYRWTVRDLCKDIMIEFSLKFSVVLIVLAIFIRLSGLPLRVMLSFLVPILILIVLFVSLVLTSLIVQENNRAYKARQFEISDEKIKIYFLDSSIIEINLENIQRVVKRRTYYFIVSQKQFYYLPSQAFPSQEDIYNFNSLLKNKKINLTWKL